MVSPCLLYFPCLFSFPCLIYFPCLVYFPCLTYFPCLFLFRVCSDDITSLRPPSTPIASESVPLVPPTATADSDSDPDVEYERTTRTRRLRVAYDSPERTDTPPERVEQVPTYTSFPSDFETQVEQSSEDERSEHSSIHYDARPSPPYDPTNEQPVSPPYDPTYEQPASPPYDPEEDRKRSASEAEPDESDSDVQIVSPPPKRYINVAERNASFMSRELGSIVNEYRYELDTRMPIDDADLKQKLADAHDRILEENKRVTGRLNMRTHSYELYRHPKNELIQVWPQGKAAVTTRLRADGLIFDAELNKSLNHLFFHPFLDEFEYPPLSGCIFARLRTMTKPNSLQLRDEPGRPRPVCTQYSDFVVSLTPFRVFRLVAKDAHFQAFNQPKYGFSLGKPVDTNLSEKTIHSWTFGTDGAIAERIVDLNEGVPRSRSRKSTKRHRK